MTLNLLSNVSTGGIDYVDISATYEFLSKVESLDSKAKEYGSTVVLSVGFAPGLTNLLASHCISRLESVHNVDIFLLLGMGEVHGESSNQWVRDNLNSEYYVRQSGEEKLVQSFGEYKQTIFPGDAGAFPDVRFKSSVQERDHRFMRQAMIPGAMRTRYCAA